MKIWFQISLKKTSINKIPKRLPSDAYSFRKEREKGENDKGREKEQDEIDSLKYPAHFKGTIFFILG
jgi:hypothetical protein